MSVRSGIQRILVSPRMFIGWMCLALLLYLPSLLIDFVLDDHLHRVKLDPHILHTQHAPHTQKAAPPALQAVLDTLREGNNTLPLAMANLFEFFDEAGEIQSALKGYGAMPWWANDEVLLKFWRPLSVLTHWLDYQFWPNSPAMMRLHSLAWFMLLLWLLCHFYHHVEHVFSSNLRPNRYSPALFMSLSGIVFVCDVSHLSAVSWIANRNVIIAGVFLLASVNTYFLGYQATNGRLRLLSSVMAALLFGCACLAAEAGVATLAFACAFVVVVDNRPWRVRVLWFLPTLGVFILWYGTYRSLGYGASGNGLYTDPGTQTLTFIGQTMKHVPTYVFAQMLGLDGIPAQMSPVLKKFMLGGTLAVVMLGSVISYRCWWFDKRLRFYAISMVIAIVPMCSLVHPMGRLMFMMSIAGAPLVAQLMLYLWSLPAQLNSRWARSLSQLSRWMFTGIHLGLVIPIWIVIVTIFLISDKPIIEKDRDLREIENVADKVLLLLNPPSSFFMIYWPLEALRNNIALPDQFYHIAPGHQPYQLTRIDNNVLAASTKQSFLMQPNSLRARSIPGEAFDMAYFRRVMDSVFGYDSHGFYSGESVIVNGIEAKIMDVTHRGEPRAYELRFPRSLDESLYVLVNWSESCQCYRTMAMPEIGETILVKGR